jgi:hypothetical protein
MEFSLVQKPKLQRQTKLQSKTTRPDSAVPQTRLPPNHFYKVCAYFSRSQKNFKFAHRNQWENQTAGVSKL